MARKSRVVRLSTRLLDPGDRGADRGDERRCDQLVAAYQWDSEGTGRLRTLTCEGPPAVIDGEVLKLPQRERTLVQAALRQIRAHTQKDDNKAVVPMER